MKDSRMRLGWMVVVLVVGVFASTGCGGDDDDLPPAVEKCQTFARTWCEATVQCLVSVGRLAESQRATNLDVCIDTAIAAAQCKRAVQISGGYNQCLSDIDAMDCQRWNVPEDQLSTVGLPATCQGVVLVSQ